MMLGGSLMMIFGFLFMVLVIALPILLIVAIIAGVWEVAGRRGMPSFTPSAPVQTGLQVQSAAAFPRFCSHCGQGLQADWTTCPKCGAPA